MPYFSALSDKASFEQKVTAKHYYHYYGIAKYNAWQYSMLETAQTKIVNRQIRGVSTFRPLEN